MLKLLKLLTSTSIFLALNSSLVVVFGDFLYGIQNNPEVLLAAFLAVFSVYNLNKATDKKEDSVNKPEIASRSAIYYVVPSVATMIFSLGIGASINLFAFFTIVTPIIIGFFYSVKLSKSLPRLKEIVGAKSVFVAFSWAMYGALLPLSLQQETFAKTVMVFIYIFIQLLVNTILFDFLDMRGDRASGVKTMPIVLGTKKTKMLLLTVNSVLGIWIAGCMFMGLFLEYLPALVFGLLYSYVIIFCFLGARLRRFYAEFMVDGEWIPIVAIMRIIMR